MSAAVITAAVMVVMSLIGLAAPKVFEGWGPYLMAGLTLLIVAQFAQIIFILLGFSGAAKLPILTWFGIALFLCFVAYDWAAALTLEYTLDNAIKASGALGLDFANLFVRILEVTGLKEEGLSSGMSSMTSSSGSGDGILDGLAEAASSALDD